MISVRFYEGVSVSGNRLCTGKGVGVEVVCTVSVMVKHTVRLTDCCDVGAFPNHGLG